MKLMIIVEKRVSEGKFLGYRASFEGRPEFAVITKFRNQSVFELMRDFGSRVGVEYREG